MGRAERFFGEHDVLIGAASDTHLGKRQLEQLAPVIATDDMQHGWLRHPESRYHVL